MTYFFEQLLLAPHAFSFLLILRTLGAVGVESIKNCAHFKFWSSASRYLSSHFNTRASRYCQSHTLLPTPRQVDTIPHTHYRYYWHTHNYITSTPWQADTYLYNTTPGRESTQWLTSLPLPSQYGDLLPSALPSHSQYLAP